MLEGGNQTEALLLLLLPFLLVGLGAYLFFHWCGMDLKSTLSLIVAPHFPSQGGSMPRGKGTDHLAITVSWLPSRCLALALGDYFLERIEQWGFCLWKERARYRLARIIVERKPGKGNWCSWIKGQSASEMEQMHSSIMWRTDFESSLDCLENLSGSNKTFRWDHLALLLDSTGEAAERGKADTWPFSRYEARF